MDDSPARIQVGINNAACRKTFHVTEPDVAAGCPASAPLRRCTGFNSKPVKKVALDAIRKEMRSRGALGDSTPGLTMTSGEYKAFDRAKDANTEARKLIECDGFVWR
jgi:hypothetical protein